MASKSAALARWKLVSEQSKQESNLRLKLMHRVHERKPLWEEYLHRDSAGDYWVENYRGERMSVSGLLPPDA